MLFQGRLRQGQILFSKAYVSHLGLSMPGGMWNASLQVVSDAPPVVEIGVEGPIVFSDLSKWFLQSGAKGQPIYRWLLSAASRDSIIITFT